MSQNLTTTEARIIGCLMEKSIVTPDQYPLTTNALTNACNQKSSRDPVMSVEPGKVQRTARELAARHHDRQATGMALEAQRRRAYVGLPPVRRPEERILPQDPRTGYD